MNRKLTGNLTLVRAMAYMNPLPVLYTPNFKSKVEHSAFQVELPVLESLPRATSHQDTQAQGTCLSGERYLLQ
jgi:hypothetical protein